MPTALQQIGDLASSILDTADSFVDTIGSNLSASAQQNQNVVDAQAARIQMEVISKKAEIEQKEKNQQLLRVVVYGVLLVFGTYMIFSGVLKLIRK